MPAPFNIELLDALGFPYMLAVPHKGQWVVFTAGGVASTWTSGSADDLYRIVSPSLEILALDAEPSPIGLATVSASVTVNTPFGIYSQPDETVLAYSMHTGASISGVTSFASDWNSGGIDALGLQVSDAGGNVPSIRAISRDGGWATSASGGALPGKHTPFVAAARWIHTTKNLSLWVNGVQDGSATTAGDYKMAPTGFRVLHHAAMATQVHLLIFGAPSDEQMAALTDLQFWSERAQSGEWFDQDEWYFEAGGGGGISVTPSPGIARALGIAPTVQLGSMAVTPAVVTAKAAAVAPTTRLGSLVIAPATAAVRALAQVGNTVLGSLSIIPAVAAAKSAALVGTVAGGAGLVVSAAAAVARAIAAAPSVVLGSLSISPGSASARALVRIGSILDAGVALVSDWLQRARRRGRR